MTSERGMIEILRRGFAPVNEDIAEFARWHLASGDVDPAYPVLRRLLPDGDEQALRFVFLYVAYYNLPSALGAWSRGVFTEPGRLPDETVAKFPTGTERRGHRSPETLIAHLADLAKIAEQHGGLVPWLREAFPSGGLSEGANWRSIQTDLRTVRGNGRWAAYKTGEILGTVLGWRLEPTDAGHDFSTGPRKGLADCYPETAHLSGFQPHVVSALDTHTRDLARWFVDKVGAHVPVEQVETILCDWHSVVNGGYYVGHDIDLMLEQINRAVERGVIDSETADRLLEIRAREFDHRWLGEIKGWDGVRRPLKRYYREHQIIRWWDWYP